jgi:serine/threonine protein kinase/tetratricopeptide (TPR) repeat protein
MPSQLERGASIDRYIIVETLGAGGMGVVYRAFDPELSRPVALKLLHGDNGGLARDRLLREAQALARLQHPNVIAIHDVGTFGGDVFIAMEFVEGKTLRKWSAEKPRPLADVLEQFLAAGEGLAAAHRAGLVHRDFKPDNVIVGDDGRVRVLDFGLARAQLTDEAVTPTIQASSDLDPDSEHTVRSRPSARSESPLPTPPAAPAPAPLVEASPAQLMDPSESGRLATPQLLATPLTQAGAIVGTPRFMAPEQHTGDATDERADQFAFCVSLYYTLYKSFPFAGATPGELLDNQLHGRILDPPVGSTVPRWLRQVLLKGLASKPADRYASMGALLAALRANPWTARRRWLGIAATVLLATSLGLGWRIALKQRARVCAGVEQRLAGVWDATRRAQVRAAFGRSRQPFATAALATVERAFDDYARAWRDMRIDTCEATHVRGEQSQELLDLRMTCLADRLTQLQTLSDLYASADDAVIERAAQSAQSLPGLGLCADAAALKAPIPPPRDPRTRERVERVRQSLAKASALDVAGRYEEGLQVGRQALTEAEALAYPPVEAEAQLRVGELFGDHGDYPESARALHQALIAALAGHHDETAASAATQLILAIGIRQAHYEEGARWAGVAEALAGRLQRKDELLGSVYTKRSMVRERAGEYRAALDDATRALEIKKRVLGPDHSSVAETYKQLGDLYVVLARYPEAIDSFERSLEILKRSLGPDHPLIARTLVGLADAHGSSGDHTRALAEYEQVLAALKRIRPDHADLPAVYNNMGSELQALGRSEEALEGYRRALDSWQKRLGPSIETTDARFNVGEALLDLKRPAEALPYFEQATAECEHAFGAGHATCGLTLCGLGEAYRRLGRLDEALATFRRAVAVSEKALAPDHPQVARALTGIGRVELERHASARARVALERALAIREHHPDEVPELASARFVLAQALWSVGERPHALALATEAREGYVKTGAPARENLAEVDAWLSQRR